MTSSYLSGQLGLTWPFFISLFLSGLLTTAESAVNRWIVFVVVVAFIVFGIVKVLRDHQKLEQSRPELGKLEMATPKKALIVLVSFGKYENLPALAAARFHLDLPSDAQSDARGTLKELWMIHTAELGPDADELSRASSSYANARKLRTEMSGHHVHVHPIEVANEDDAYEVYTKSVGIYNYGRHTMRLDANELAADITGGTKAMTIGLAMAGIPLDRDLEYTRAKEKDANGRPVYEAGNDHVLINVNFVHK